MSPDLRAETAAQARQHDAPGPVPLQLHPMGAGASLPPRIDKQAAKKIAGDAYDDDAFDKAAKDGSVSRKEFLAMAKDRVGGSSTNAAAVPRASAPEAGAPAGKKANSKKAGKAKVSVVEECRAASPFSKASMARVHAFLLGTHPRAGEESLVRKLTPDTVRKILMDVREPALPAPDVYHFASKVPGGTIDMWVIISQPPTVDSWLRGNREPPRVVMQHSDGDTSRRKGPKTTRYLGVFEELQKICAHIRFTHKASGVKPSCPPGATAEELHADGLPNGGYLDTAAAAAADSCVAPCYLDLSKVKRVQIQVLKMDDEKVTISGPRGANVDLLPCPDSAGTSAFQCARAMHDWVCAADQLTRQLN